VVYNVTTQLLAYCTNEALECETCLPSDVVLCVPTALTADSLGFIEGSLISFSKTSSCAGCVRTYNIEYDDALLLDPSEPLLSCEVSGIFCKDCRTRWLQDFAENFLTGWYTDALGNFIQSQGYSGEILYNGELKIQSNTLVGSDSGGVTLIGGGANSSTRGATIDVRGIGAGGALSLKGSNVATGVINITMGHGLAPIKINDPNDFLMWSFTTNGDFNGDATRGGDVILNRLGKTLHVKSGANGKAGTFVANGATAVVVATTGATANMVVAYGINTIGGTPAGAPYISAVVPGTSFSVQVAAGDTSTYNYIILGLI